MQRARWGTKFVTSLLAVAIACLCSSATTEAATLQVANYGTDAPSCGERSHPCRSIGTAMANASDGSTIVVGPGVYGDLNGNSILGEAGEEVDDPAGLVVVRKTLTVVSSHGAGSTVIDSGAARAVTAVSIRASDVVFGRKNKGFTILNGLGDGLRVEVGAQRVSIVGNVVLQARFTGFVFQGGAAVVRDNWALRLPSGFYGIAGSLAVLEGNVAANDQNTGFAFIDVGGAVVRRNVANNNGVGFYFGFTFPTEPGLAEFSWNTITANRSYGVRIDAYDVPEAGFTQSLHDNNVYGNGELFYGGIRNCGLTVSNFSQWVLTLDAANNFWGAATPGGDPADAAGGECDYGGPVRVESGAAAARPFQAKLRPIR
jgi:Periplasmic copper-binding protein (NosD)